MKGLFGFLVGICVFGWLISVFSWSPTAESLKTMKDHVSVEFRGTVQSISTLHGSSASEAKVSDVTTFVVDGMTVMPKHGDLMILDLQGNWKKESNGLMFMGEGNATLHTGDSVLIHGHTAGDKVEAYQIGVP